MQADADDDFLPRSFSRRTELPVVAATDRLPIAPGNIYVAPRGCHVLLEPGFLRVVEQPPMPVAKSHAVDELLRSAAQSYERRVIGVLLSGMLNDGTAGFWEIRKHGGITIVQDPAEATYPSMPDEAMKDVPVHYCLSVAEIGSKLVQLVNGHPADEAGRYAPRILIVEDERIIAMNLETRLTELGYNVVASVSSGEAAVGSLVNTSPDIVLMDIHLSGRMTGTEAARIIWEQHGIPIVYLTAYSDEDTVECAKPSMPYAFIVKPYRPAEIHAAIQLVFARREREQEGFTRP